MGPHKAATCLCLLCHSIHTCAACSPLAPQPSCGVWLRSTTLRTGSGRSRFGRRPTWTKARCAGQGPGVPLGRRRAGGRGRGSVADVLAFARRAVQPCCVYQQGCSASCVPFCRPGVTCAATPCSAGQSTDTMWTMLNYACPSHACLGARLAASSLLHSHATPSIPRLARVPLSPTVSVLAADPLWPLGLSGGREAPDGPGTYLMCCRLLGGKPPPCQQGCFGACVDAHRLCQQPAARLDLTSTALTQRSLDCQPSLGGNRLLLLAVSVVPPHRPTRAAWHASPTGGMRLTN